jgi:hypothetical protein
MTTQDSKQLSIVTVEDTASVRYADLLALVPFGQSKYQTEQFLVNQHRTPHRQLRQILLQYDQLCYTLIGSQNKQAQTALDLDDKQNQIDRLEHKMAKGDFDKFDTRDAEIKISKLRLEIEEINVGRQQGAKMLDDAFAEKKTFENALAKVIPEVQALEAQGITFDVAEKGYWSERFLEDARLTLFGIKTGHQVDKEIMRAITQMEPEGRAAFMQGLGMDPQLLEQSGLLDKPVLKLSAPSAPEAPRLT